jgi:DMSO reductase anchor subunit
MHPAPSVILFTTLSGLGFGLLAFLGLGYPGVTGWVAFVFYAIAYGLAVGGLLASTFHLGHPERALKAFSQWRTSWLSREGICAVAALLVMGLYAIGAVFFENHWPVLGMIGAGLSLGTVFTTSMIYTQLKTIPRWNMPLTPVMFLSFSLAGGALLAGQESLATWLLLAAAAVQLAYCGRATRPLPPPAPPWPVPPVWVPRGPLCAPLSRPIPAATTCCGNLCMWWGADTRKSCGP